MDRTIQTTSIRLFTIQVSNAHLNARSGKNLVKLKCLLFLRRKLDSKNVSLENVIVKENESVVVGTIKVRNLSFHKEVIVRTSWNDWQSQEDTFCTYSQVKILCKPSLAYFKNEIKISRLLDRAEHMSSTIHFRLN